MSDPATNAILTPTELTRLGLGDLSAGVAVRLPAADDRALGFSTAAPLDLGALVVGPHRWLMVSVPEIEEAGFQVQRLEYRPEVIVISRADRPLATRGSLVPNAIHVVDDASIVLDLDALPGEPIVILGDDRVGVAVRPTEGTLGLVYTRLPGLRRPLEVTSDVRAWARATGDSWLVDEVERRLGSGAAFDEAIAVGLVVRLSPVPNARELARQLVASGPVDRAHNPERAWARSLDTETRASLVQHALAGAEQLLDALGGVIDDPAFGEPDWERQVVELARRRDDLEGVRVLLAYVGAATAPAAILSEVDKVGARVFAALPVLESWRRDEQLTRSASADPECWWSAPAAARHGRK